MKTTSLKQKEISKEWILINAEGAVLGRLASYVSILLRGKLSNLIILHIWIVEIM